MRNRVFPFWICVLQCFSSCKIWVGSRKRRREKATRYCVLSIMLWENPRRRSYIASNSNSNLYLASYIPQSMKYSHINRTFAGVIHDDNSDNDNHHRHSHRRQSHYHHHHHQMILNAASREQTSRTCIKDHFCQIKIAEAEASMPFFTYSMTFIVCPSNRRPEDDGKREKGTRVKRSSVTSRK